MNYHIIVSRTEDQFEYLLEDCTAGYTTWTVNAYARKGDVVLFYMTLPIGAIVARGCIAKEPYRHNDPESSLHNRFMCDIEDLEMLERPIPRQLILSAIPSWRYWLTPIMNHRVRREHADHLKQLLKDASAA